MSGMSFLIGVFIFIISIGLVIWCKQYVQDREQQNRQRLVRLNENNVDFHANLYNQYLDLGSHMSNIGSSINQNNEKIGDLETLRSHSVNTINTMSNEVVAKLEGLKDDYMSVQDIATINSEIERQRSLIGNTRPYHRKLDTMVQDINKLRQDSKQISENVYALNNFIIPTIETGLATIGVELEATFDVYASLSNNHSDMVSQFAQFPFQKFNDIGKLVTKPTCEALEKRVQLFADTVDNMQFAYNDIRNDNQQLKTVQEKVTTLSNMVSKYPRHYEPVLLDMKKQVGNFDISKTKTFLDQPALKQINTAFGGSAYQDYNRFNQNYTELSKLPEWAIETTNVVQRAKSIKDTYNDNVSVFKERVKKSATDVQQISQLTGEIEELRRNVVQMPANKVVVSNANTMVRTNKTDIQQNLCLKTGDDTICISNDDMKTILQGPDEFDPTKNCQQIYMGRQPFLEDVLGRKLVLDENKMSKKGIVTLTGPTGKKVFQFTRDYFPDSWTCGVDNKNGVVAVYVPPNKKIRLFSTQNADYYADINSGVNPLSLEGGSSGQYITLTLNDTNQHFKRVCSVEYGDELMAPKDCSAGAWINDAPCPTHCGYPGGTIHKTRVVTDGSYGGRKCSPQEQSTTETKTCQPGPPCPIDCRSDVRAISECLFEGNTCAPAGRQHEGRRRMERYRVVNAQHGGRDCPDIGQYDEQCHVNQVCVQAPPQPRGEGYTDAVDESALRVYYKIRNKLPGVTYYVDVSIRAVGTYNGQQAHIEPAPFREAVAGDDWQRRIVTDVSPRGQYVAEFTFRDQYNNVINIHTSSMTIVKDPNENWRLMQEAGNTWR